MQVYYRWVGTSCMVRNQQGHNHTIRWFRNICRWLNLFLIAVFCCYVFYSFLYFFKPDQLFWIQVIFNNLQSDLPLNINHSLWANNIFEKKFKTPYRVVRLPQSVSPTSLWFMWKTLTFKPERRGSLTDYHIRLIPQTRGALTGKEEERGWKKLIHIEISPYLVHRFSTIFHPKLRLIFFSSSIFWKTTSVAVFFFYPYIHLWTELK